MQLCPNEGPMNPTRWKLQEIAGIPHLYSSHTFCNPPNILYRGPHSGLKPGHKHGTMVSNRRRHTQLACLSPLNKRSHSKPNQEPLTRTHGSCTVPELKLGYPPCKRDNMEPKNKPKPALDPKKAFHLCGRSSCHAVRHSALAVATCLPEVIHKQGPHTPRGST